MRKKKSIQVVYKKIYTTLYFADQQILIEDSEVAAYVKHITYTNSSGALLTQGPLFWFVQQRRLSFMYRTYELTQGSLATCSRKKNKCLLALHTFF